MPSSLAVATSKRGLWPWPTWPGR